MSQWFPNTETRDSKKKKKETAYQYLSWTQEILNEILALQIQ